jgi:hypothetical protein
VNLASSLSAIVTTIAEVAVVLVGLVVVRPRRPDAYGWLVAGAGLHLFVTLSFPFFADLATRIATMGTIRLVYGVIQVGAAVLRAAGWGLLAFGAAQLSGSPPPSPLGAPSGEPEPPEV